MVFNASYVYLKNEHADPHCVRLSDKVQVIFLLHVYGKGFF